MANVLWLLSKLDLRNLSDIVLVAAIIYGVLVMVQGTQAVQLLRGIILLALAVSLFGSIAELTAFNWLLRSAGQALLVIVAIVLQPELRRALDRLGRAGGISLWSSGPVIQLDRMIDEIAAACRRFSEHRHGALIVIERETGLQDYIDTGVTIDAAVADQLLQTIFFPNTPLHDGAVVIRGDRIVAASCVLPLAETILSDVHLGTRHRAAVGITEQTDAVAVVVSEETGIISMARNGRMVRHLDERRLTTLLHALLQPQRGGSGLLNRAMPRRENAPDERSGLE
ncbi:MAG: diadenylate cyclase CdaA [Anaerolineae bacterium]|nr:TIGR00159 family protein [Chloroflexota bacterium]